ncbi:hydrolase [Clostridia bacterium]|nr:hydrolase [Clostridia bacterium]
MRHDIRLIVTDLDGTLISDEDSVSEANLRALHDAYEVGVQVALCSGRSPKDVSEIALAAGLDDAAIIALNGAVSLDRPLGEILEDHRISSVSARTCLEILLPQSGDLVAYKGEQKSEITLSSRPRGSRFFQKASQDETSKQMFYALAVDGLNKLFYSEMDHPERLRAVRKKLMLVPGIDITSSWFTNIEIMPTGVNKGNAVRAMANRMGINLDQVIAFGDNDNDASMLSLVGYGVAMGNATDAARSAARYTTDSSVGNGVAKAIERFILMQDKPA